MVIPDCDHYNFAEVFLFNYADSVHICQTKPLKNVYWTELYTGDGGCVTL